MKFELSTIGSAYTKEEADKLRKFGLTFRKDGKRHSSRTEVHRRGADEAEGSPAGLMVTVWSEDTGEDLYTNAWSDEGTIELETLEDLIAFAREWGKLIITPDTDPYSGGPGIEIYDDYAE